MARSHGVTQAEANEALGDPNRVTLNPDPSSLSSRSVRVIGQTELGRVLSIIVLEAEGAVWGVNGWDSNPTDCRRYLTGGMFVE